MTIGTRGPRGGAPSGGCAICGTWRQRLQRDHITPRFRGGGNELANIQLLCANCHEDKTIADMSSYKMPADARTRIAIALRGHPVDRRTRARLARRGRSRRASEATRQKMSAARVGRPKSPEHRAKIAAATKRHWAEVRLPTLRQLKAVS